ncbi:c-type cytochrome [Haloferula sp.]|uniref:c-type cytochrome n=1 Tax=Haloferula sp. TaxID=2497595 RepID=UPI003C71D0D6
MLRTFMPEPGLDTTVLSRHSDAANSPKYNPNQGKDIPGQYTPIGGLPAAIGVNYGSEFSYCWDTTECRLLYAWKGGFLDMESYWGDPERGTRLSNAYVPHLVGTMFYQAKGKHPIQLAGTSLSDLSEPPKFLGHHKQGNDFVFELQAGGNTISCTISKGEKEYQLQARYTSTGQAELSYSTDLPGHQVKTISPREILITIQGEKIRKYNGNPAKSLLTGGINLASGEKIFEAMACGSCHSLDGSLSHGPSLLNLHGKKREINGSKTPVLADDAYILESIKTPNAKIAAGFPENYMPPYQLKDGEYQALLIYIKSIKK